MQPLLRASTLCSLIYLIIISLLATFASPAQLLDQNEKAALKKIATKLSKTDWDFSVDPCSGKGNWRNPESAKGLQSDVACDCSFNNNTKCHISSILLKGQNLSGTLPAEFGKFLHLQQLDLSRNLLTGTVPKEWKNMKLLGLSFMGNKLSGTFPTILTNITTLTNLSVEGNDFRGPIPRELGKLVNMEKLVISANGFTGELPSLLAKLTKLTDLRISSNNFSGKIPDFINRFTKLEKLHIQGCNFKGPIPPSISLLTSLTDLRISDLRGNASLFPDLRGMTNLKTLVLRNCSIQGSIPPYIGNLDYLKHLDLSFNLLNGPIPSTFGNLGKVDFIYLTGNMLTGTIPGWVLKRNKNVDISYNNFTFGNSGPTQCLEGSVNIVESYSPVVNSVSSVSSCLKRHFPCSSSRKQYFLHINCGGKQTSINGTEFEPDLEERGASTLYLSNSNWGFSSTGNFMDNDVDADSYIAANSSKLSMPNSQLYTRARLSPISLTYFGLCMSQGSYTVKLHFAEIVFTNDSTYYSLGKRLFNVFIQDRMVLENFNVAEAAGGPGIAVIETFNSSVTDSTLEIRLQWAGKGTTGIPYRGYYGPLISAISVTPNFRPPLDSDSSNARKKRVIIISGVVAALALILITLVLVIWRRRHIKNSMYRELKCLDLQTGLFSLRQIKAATKNFDPANKLGEGGFGSVYKGLLADGTVIAVKQLSSRSRQGNREFITELGVISALQHPNLVKLYGCCAEGNQLLLIYEYMENNSLAHILFSRNPQIKLKLDWATRLKICLGVARGLAYLHEESILKIVHRDIKGSNILLDKDLNAKISDFGLAKLDEQDHSHITTRVAGTIGYMAPEYAMRGHLTYKADIYSFGVVALELVSGKSNTNYTPKDDFVYLLDWACVLHERGSMLELVDPDLGSDYSVEEALVVLKVALLCTNSSPTLRPSMSEVVKLLEGRASLQPLISNIGMSANGSSSDGIRRNFWQNPSDSQTISITIKSLDQSDPANELLLSSNPVD